MGGAEDEPQRNEFGSLRQSFVWDLGKMMDCQTAESNGLVERSRVAHRVSLLRKITEEKSGYKIWSCKTEQAEKAIKTRNRTILFTPDGTPDSSLYQFSPGRK